jgi:hypothetical protein
VCVLFIVPLFHKTVNVVWKSEHENATDFLPGPRAPVGGGGGAKLYVKHFVHSDTVNAQEVEM